MWRFHTGRRDCSIIEDESRTRSRKLRRPAPPTAPEAPLAGISTPSLKIRKWVGRSPSDAVTEAFIARSDAQKLVAGPVAGNPAAIRRHWRSRRWPEPLPSKLRARRSVPARGPSVPRVIARDNLGALQFRSIAEDGDASPWRAVFIEKRSGVNTDPRAVGAFRVSNEKLDFVGRLASHCSRQRDLIRRTATWWRRARKARSDPPTRQRLHREVRSR